MQRYPTALPLGEASGYAQSITNSVLATQMESGKVFRRRIAANAPDMLNVKWLFTGAELRTFRAWFENALQGGQEAFIMPIWKDEQAVYVECAFEAEKPIKATMDANSQTLWNVSGNLIIVNSLTDDDEATADVTYSISATIDYMSDALAAPADDVAIGTILVDHTVTEVRIITRRAIDGSGTRQMNVGYASNVIALVDTIDVSTLTKWSEEVVDSTHSDKGASIDSPITAASTDYVVRLSQPSPDTTQGEFTVLIMYTKD